MYNHTIREHGKLIGATFSCTVISAIVLHPVDLVTTWMTTTKIPQARLIKLMIIQADDTCANGITNKAQYYHAKTSASCTIH